MKPAIFTTITPVDWRHALVAARARRRDRQAAIKGFIRVAENKAKEHRPR
jgi:hypothetical protein